MIKRHIYFTDRKRYYRNLNARIRYAERKIEKRIIGQIEKIEIKRTRQQVVFNELYSISARAIMINGNVTEQQLENALIKTLKREGYINLFGSPSLSIGYEEERIDSDEDAGLIEGIIHIEINQKGVVSFYNL